MTQNVFPPQLAIVILVTAFFMNLYPAVADDKPTLAELIAEVRAAEAKFKYLSVDAHWRSLDSLAKMDSKVLVSGAPLGKAKLEMDQMLRWKEGASPYAGDVFTIAYDGDVGMRANHRSGISYNMSERKTGELWNERPSGLENYRENVGLHHTLNHTFPGRTASEMLALEQNVITIRRDETSSSSNLVVVEIQDRGAMQRVLYLDAEHGYAVVRRQRFVTRDVEGTEVEPFLGYDSVGTELVEAAPGFWLPTRIATYWSNGAVEERYTIELENVTAPASIDASEFRIDFPPDYRIQDNRTENR